MKYSSSVQQTPHYFQGLAPVTSTKVVPMVQVVKQLVKLISFVKSRGFGNDLVVGRVKSRCEAPEHGSNAEVILMVAVEGGWVKDHGLTPHLTHISSPEVTMKQ